MNKQRYINDDFRIFEIVKDVEVFSNEYGHRVLTEGYRFVGFYYADESIWISNTDYTLSKEYTKELYNINLTDI